MLKEGVNLSKFYKAGTIILENQVVHDSYLEVDEQGKFRGIHEMVSEEAKVADYSAYTIAPGLVDTHIHGYAGYDVMDVDFEGLNAISEGLLSCGVTSFLPTTLTDSTENLNAVCELIGNRHEEVNGAKIRGIFLEGPFFTEEHKGAQNPKYMSDPSIEKLDKWDELSNDLVNKIAIAPERDGVTDFIEYANSKEIRTALAHSNATYEEAKRAVDAGANIFIHTFNGMSGLHHREPGMVGAALSLDNVYAEIIADGHHVHPVAMDIVMKARGKDKTVLVTDCMRAGGQGEGNSMLGEFEVLVKDGAARLKSNNSLAGSVLELMTAVQNIVEWDLATLAEAIHMASLNPAKSVGIDNVCGKIAEGYDADFIVLDENAQLQATYLNGEERYTAKA